MNNVVPFPIIPRPVPKTPTIFRVTIVKEGGKRIVERAANKVKSMDLLLDMLRQHPDAKKISVIKEGI